jgi:hypothetical protein
MKCPYITILFVELNRVVRQQADYGPASARDSSHVGRIMVLSLVNLVTEAREPGIIEVRLMPEVYFSPRFDSGVRASEGKL